MQHFEHYIKVTKVQLI